MNTETDRSSERVWKFQHGELDEATRASMEREMAGDAGLRRSVEEAGRVDRLLRELLPALGGADAAEGDVAGLAQAAWEQEQPRAQVLRPAWAAWQRKARSAAVGVAGLAAAAALVLVFGPAAWQAPGVRWAEPEFARFVVRGGGELARHAVDAGAARRCQAALRAAVEARAAERGLELPRGLTFSFRLQELRDGAFSVAVQARARGGDLAGEWYGDYSGEEAFRKQAKDSAARMVEALAERLRGEREGGRP